MITQKMVEALQSVPLNISSTRRGGENGLRNAEEVLAVVYPLILEQAAQACWNERVESQDDPTDISYNAACEDCADAIRSLKDKTDEAHNEK